MKKLLFILPLLLIGCGEDKPVEEVVKLETFKDRLSYSLGVMNGRALKEDPMFSRYDQAKVVEGFANNFSESSIDDCETTLRSLLGPYGTDFDTTFKESGSLCQGRIISHYFYTGMKDFGKIDEIDVEKMTKGFEHALGDRDTLISVADQQTLIQEFYQKILNESAERMFADARKIENIQELEGGILMQVIEEGKGGSPADKDDVRADYILTSSTGDTLQNSLMFRQDPNDLENAPAFNLQQVFPGWTKSLPHMKKGGKYRIFLPWEMVADPRLQGQSVIFYIHLIDFGPAFSIAEQPQYQ